MIIIIINIPYGQSSAKLPVTRSLGHLVTWSLGHLVTWSLSHSVTYYTQTHNIKTYRSASQTITLPDSHN